MKKCKAWTLKEEKYLRDNDCNVSMNQAMKYLGRSKSSVRNKAIQLNIKLLKEWEVDKYAYYKDNDFVTEGTIYKISDFTGIKPRILKTYTYKSIQDRLNRILIKLEDEENE